jgi:hypothetical protein
MDGCSFFPKEGIFVSSSDYIPAADGAFLPWARNLIAYVTQYFSGKGEKGPPGNIVELIVP